MVVGAGYVHGYESRENARLQDQAGTLVDLLHADTQYPAGSLVLEAGCGVGAQTVTLARRSPGARFISVDISLESIAEARRRTHAAGLTNVELRQADIFALPFERGSFDHVFVCFVLEHLPRPVDALQLLKELVKPGGTVTVIEGDHGSTYFHPESEAARRAIQCLVELQRAAGGNALIGRQLYPLMLQAGLEEVHVSPRMVYVDSRRPDLVDGFTRKTFTAMVEGVRESAIEAGLVAPDDFDAGVRDLRRTAEADGVFCYTFFKGVGRRGGGGDAAASVESMWAAFLAANPEVARSTSHGTWHFCDNQADADGLARLVVSGRKRATTSSLWASEREGERLPRVGDLNVIADWEGRARCVIRTTAVEVLPFEAVTPELAAAEGEGDGSLEQWRDAHWEAFSRELGRTGRQPALDMPVVCERFAVVFAEPE